MLNSVILMGRLTRDPELKYTQSELPVCSFSLAAERDYSPNGEKATDFINCVAWRGTAQFVKQYFGKGQMMAVRGRLQTREWEDRDGGKRRTVEVLTENVYFAGSKKTEKTEPLEEPESWNCDNEYSQMMDPDGDLPF